MTAYVLMIREVTTDGDALKQYSKLAMKAAAGHSLVPRAFYSPHEVWEGADCEGVVILEFPDTDEARAWYESPAYQEALQHRKAGSRYQVILVDDS